MMKSLQMAKKTIVIGGLAAALLVGGTIPGFLSGSAHAAETTTATTTTSKYNAIVEQNLSGLVGYVAALSGRQENEVRNELSSGKNLADLSGIGYPELLKRLTASLNQSIDLTAQTDKTTSREEIDQVKSDSVKRLSTILTTNAYDDTKHINVDYAKIVKNNISGLVGYVAAVSGRKDTEVRSELRSGKNLADLSGIGYSQLFSRLTASLNQSIDQAAQNDKVTTSEQLSRIKSDAAARISTIITTGSYDDTVKVNVDYEKIVNDSLSSVVGYVSAIAGREESEIRTELANGKSLADLSGISQSELLNRLTVSLNQSIDHASQNDKTVSTQELSQIKSDAEKRLAEIITTNGYEDSKSVEVDYNKIIESYLGGINGYVAVLSGKRVTDISASLQGGKSLGDLSGLGADKLAKDLSASLIQSIELAAKRDKNTTQEELSRIKSDAEARILKIVSASGSNK
ncbi:hypothetical protein ACFFNY_04125 [Paenibacillus hodogayensis]|uniref:SbsC C-terminal domain-containing protein n=1 Tax=Paenibacillus hodogayensis TaxID=279208 RepID=A0ABV5VR50_9BACL